MSRQQPIVILLLVVSMANLNCRASGTDRLLVADRMLVGEAVGTHVLPLDLAAVGVSWEEMEECAKDLWPAYQRFSIRPLHSAAAPKLALAFVTPSRRYYADAFEHRYIAFGWEQSGDCRDLFVSREQLINVSAANSDNEVMVRHLQAGLLALRIDRDLRVSDVAVVCEVRDLHRAAELLALEFRDTSMYSRMYSRLEWCQKYRYNELTWYPGWWGYSDSAASVSMPESLTVGWPTVRIDGENSKLTFYALALRKESPGSLIPMFWYELLKCDVRFESGAYSELIWATLRSWGGQGSFETWAEDWLGDSAVSDTPRQK